MNRRDWLNLTADERRDYLRREVVGATLYRDFSIPADAIDEKARTVDVSISSDRPYDRGWYTEILSHEKGAVRLERLNDGGAYLKDHDTKIQLGAFVRGTVAIKPDPEDKKFKKLGGTVLYSERKVADDELKDVIAGIRTKTSVGYVIYKYEYDEKTDTLTATDWEPLEGSNVAIAADITTGPGRSRELRNRRAGDTEPDDEAECDCDDPDCDDPNCDGQSSKSKSQKNRSHPTHTTRRMRRARKGATQTRTTMKRRKKSTTPTAERNEELTCRANDPDCGDSDCDVHYEDDTRAAAAPPAPKNYAQRFREIAEAAALGAEEKKRFLVIASNRALESDEPDETEFRQALVADRKKHAKDTTPDPEDPKTVADRNGGAGIRVTPRVRLKFLPNTEEGRAIAFGLGRFLTAIDGPKHRGNTKSKDWCRENGVSLQRAQSESDNESGGIWIPEDWSDRLVILRENYGLVRQFSDVETMTGPTKNVRRQRQGLKAYPAGAKGASRKVAESEMKWDFFELIARKWKVTTKFEDELLSDAEQMAFADRFAGESAYAFAFAEDDAFFNADGSSTYHGISGLKTQLRAVDAIIANIKGLVVATGNLFSEFVLKDFTNTVAALPQYADNENTAWYMHRTFFWNTVVPLLIAAGGTTVKQIEDAPNLKLLSYPVRISQVLPRADANSQIACYLGDLTKSSTFGDRQGQQVRMTDTNDDDWDNDLISMKAIERFDENHHDVGDTTNPGPVVGLISAAS